MGSARFDGAATPHDPPALDHGRFEDERSGEERPPTDGGPPGDSAFPARSGNVGAEVPVRATGSTDASVVERVRSRTGLVSVARGAPRDGRTTAPLADGG
jgi:hypothetical protein